MKASLRALLAGVIDYAGIFPPAELSLDQSIRNYARYRREPEAWMLGRFVCPASRLKELDPYLKSLFADGAPLPIAALGRGGKSAEEFVAGFGRDVQTIVEFMRQARSRADVPVMETKVPADLAVGFDFDSNRLRLFLESSPMTDWRRSIASAIEFTSKLSYGCGFKLRSGGVEASAFPSAEQIAFAIVRCRDRNLPLKFTAGLHHPMRHFNRSVNAKVHGFINVFTAGVLAHVSNLTEDQMVPILEDEESASFVFDDDVFRWRDLGATTKQIVSIREKYLISFGSCSFDEPREDLRGMDWL